MAATPISPDLYQLCSTERWGRNDTHKILGQFLSEYPFFVDALKGSLKNEKAQFWTRTPSISEVAQPTVAGMKKIAAHYAVKYAITIKVLSIEEFVECAKVEPGDSVFGLIIYNEDPAIRLNKHVISVLVQSLQGKKDAIILNSLGNLDLEPVQSVLLENRFTTYFSPFISQADDHSCRTDALCTLRNGLLAHKYAAKESPLYYLSEQFSSDPTSDKDLWQMQSIPHEWVYTAQVSNKAPGDERSIAIRDCFSKKRTSLRTVTQFRVEYQEELTVVHLLAPEIDRGFPIAENEVCSSPPGIQLISVKPDEYQIAKTVLKSVNTYLARKSFKNLRKHFTG
jgi:hypothetical protein